MSRGWDLRQKLFLCCLFTSASFVDNLNSLKALQPVIYRPEQYRWAEFHFTHFTALKHNTLKWHHSYWIHAVTVFLNRKVTHKDINQNNQLVNFITNEVISHHNSGQYTWALSQTCRWYNTCLIAFCYLHLIQGLVLWEVQVCLYAHNRPDKRSNLYKCRGKPL